MFGIHVAEQRNKEEDEVLHHMATYQSGEGWERWVVVFHAQATTWGDERWVVVFHAQATTWGDERWVVVFHA